MTIGERIKARRKALGISADKLADAVGVCRSTIFRYENNYISKYPIQVIEPIAHELNTTVGYLMGWNNDRAASDVLENDCNSEILKCLESMSDKTKREALNYLHYLASKETAQ